MLDFLIIIGVGLVNFLYLGNVVDSFIYLIAERQTNPKIRQHILNALRPIILTLIIFGGGAVAIYWTSIGTLGITLSFIFYFGLSYFACLSGRTVTYYQSGGAMVFSMILVLVLFSLLL